MGRSDIEHIIGWKDRRGQARIGAQLTGEVDRISRAWVERKDIEHEFRDFVPMRLVTIIEVFVREIVREIVDYGDPYIERAETLVRGAKIDFIFASNVHKQKLSIGDIVAHSISVNNPTQIISSLSSLIPDFTRKLKLSHPRWSEEKSSWPLKPIINNYDALIARLARLFEIRHIITHEMPSKPVYNTDEVDDLITSAYDFLDATDWVIVETLRGETPRTQSAMNFQAGDELGESQKKMEEILQIIRGKEQLPAELLSASQTAWEEYADKEADLHASLVEGGSMYPLIWASTKNEVTEQRIKNLSWWLKKEEGDI